MRRSEDVPKSGPKMYSNTNFCCNITAIQHSILSAKGLYRKRKKKGVPDPSDIPVCLLCKFLTPNYIST